MFECDMYCDMKMAYVHGEVTDELVKNFMNQNDQSFVMDFVGFLRRSIGVRDRLISERCD